MKAEVVKVAQSPAERRMKAAADELAERHFRQFAADVMGRSAEFQIQASRKLNRLAVALVAERGDGARAMGIISGSAAMIQPAHCPERPAHAAAEALFAKAED